MKILCLDTETTGLIDNASTPLDKQPAIIEWFSCTVDTDSGEISDELELLVKPNKPISAEITRITGIDDEMVKEARSFADVAPSIREKIESAQIACAHNLSFDREMTNLCFRRLDQYLQWPKRQICTVESSIHLRGIRLNLQTLHELLFNERFKEAHRARNDVMALVRCVIELAKRGEI